MERFVHWRQRSLSKTVRSGKEKVSRRNGKVQKELPWVSQAKGAGEKREEEKESQVKKIKGKHNFKKCSSKIKSIKGFRCQWNLLFPTYTLLCQALRSSYSKWELINTARIKWITRKYKKLA